MKYKQFVVTASTVVLLAGALVSCNRSEPNAATPTPTPEPTATPTATLATPTPTPVITTPTPTPVAVVPTPTPEISPSPTIAATLAPTPGPINDAATLAGELDKSALVGRHAELTGLKVDSLVGDRAFYVFLGDKTQRMLIVLDKKLNEGAADAKLKIKPGQTLSIQGGIDKLPDTRELAERFGVQGKETEALKKETVYLHADQVTITREAGTR